MSRPKRNVTGKVFNKLTVIRDENQGKKAKVVCRCECGKEVVVLKGNVISGNTKSCGCYRRKKTEEVV